MRLGLDADSKNVIQRLLGYVRPYRAVLLPAMFAIVVYAVVTGLVPIFLRETFDQLKDDFVDSSQAAAATGIWGAMRLPAALLGLWLLRSVSDFFTVYSVNWVGRSAVRDLRADLFRQYLYLPAPYYDSHATGDLISKLTFNTEQTADAVSNALVILVRDSLLVAVMVGVLLYLNWQLTLMLAIVGPVIALLLRAMSRAFRRYSTRIQNSMGDVTRLAGQALQGQRVVKIFSGQELETARFKEINERNFRLHLRLVATRAFGDSITQFVVVLGVCVIVFFILSGLLTENVDSAEFAGFVTALAIALTALKRLVNTNANFQRGIAAAEGLFAVLDEPAESNAVEPEAQSIKGELSFVDVSFRYGEDQDEILHRVDFELEPGKTLAIVGRSGSGKSTLVSLVPRFYDVTSGAVLLDGRDVRDYALQSLRHQISFVGQEVVIFDDTIAGNIAYGAMVGASRADIERVAEIAHVSGFAAELPDGLDSRVGEGGSLLSGGQRQRIAIARALLKDAPVLILDEATSALDTESERKVQAALNELMRGRTTLVIAHRLSTVERADRIIVMHDGRIVESGTHSELIEANGAYSSLHRLQFAD